MAPIPDVTFNTSEKIEINIYLFSSSPTQEQILGDGDHMPDAMQVMSRKRITILDVSLMMSEMAITFLDFNVLNVKT